MVLQVKSQSHSVITAASELSSAACWLPLFVTSSSHVVGEGCNLRHLNPPQRQVGISYRAAMAHESSIDRQLDSWAMAAQYMT